MTIEDRLHALLVPAVIAQLSEMTAAQGSVVPYSVFFAIGQGPLETQQESLVTSLRKWEFQFSSFAVSPALARAETKKILDYLTTFSDVGIRAVFLQAGSRRVEWDEITKLAQSMADLTIWEALG